MNSLSDSHFKMCYIVVERISKSRIRISSVSKEPGLDRFGQFEISNSRIPKKSNVFFEYPEIFLKFNLNLEKVEYGSCWIDI